MNTAIIYRIVNMRGIFFSLNELQPNESGMYDGTDNGGKEYSLPEGFEVAKSREGSREFYDRDCQHYEVVRSQNGKYPVLSGYKGVFPLKQAR